MTHAASFCSLRPTRHAARMLTTHAAMLMRGPITGIQLSSRPAPIAMRISQGFRSPSLAKTIVLYTGTQARQRPCTPALSKIFIRNHDPST